MHESPLPEWRGAFVRNGWYIVSSMRYALLAILIINICSLACRGVSAAGNGEPCSVSSRYVIRSMGMDIGTVNARMSGTPVDNDLRADVDVNVGVLFFDFSLKSTESTCIRAGKMVRYNKIIVTGGNHREIAGELVGGMLTVVVRDGEKEECKRFSATNFDATTMEYPEVTLAPGEVRRMRVLDLENSEVVEREYRYVAEEHAEIDGRPSRIIVADFVDKNAECRRWTAIINGLPIVIRQEGKEKTGLFNPAYSVQRMKAAVGF